jgi:hypothetical protein
MSKPEEIPAVEPEAGLMSPQTVTVVPSHEGEDAMGLSPTGVLEPGGDRHVGASR